MSSLDPNPRPKRDVHNPHSNFGQKWVTFFRKIYNPIGFKKGYNFPLWVICTGAMFGFILAKSQYLSWSHFSKEAAPGEFYYFRHGSHRVGILIHLATIIPACYLVLIQFVPIIRYKAILVHRINGYIVSTLLLISNAGAFMVMQVSIGGQPNLIVWIGVIGALTTMGTIIAIVNVKRLQIDVHRAWMLRVWIWCGSIITLRVLQIAAIHVSNVYGITYHITVKCSEVYYMYKHVGVPDQGNPVGQLYPQCNTASDAAGIPTGQSVNPEQNYSTWVSISSAGSGPEAAAAQIHNIFPMAAWLALFLHAFAVEVYLWLTPAESYRLRNVSYEKQIEKGLRKRGAFKDAGTTGTTIGDAPEWWSIPAQDYEEQKRLVTEIAQAREKLNNPASGSDSEGANTLVGN